MFKVGDKVRFVGSAGIDESPIDNEVPPNTTGQVVDVMRGPNTYPYTVRFDNGVSSPVRECEIEPAPSSDSDAHA